MKLIFLANAKNPSLLSLPHIATLFPLRGMKGIALRKSWHWKASKEREIDLSQRSRSFSVLFIGHHLENPFIIHGDGYFSVREKRDAHATTIKFDMKKIFNHDGLKLHCVLSDRRSFFSLAQHVIPFCSRMNCHSYMTKWCKIIFSVELENLTRVIWDISQ